MYKYQETIIIVEEAKNKENTHKVEVNWFWFASFLANFSLKKIRISKKIRHINEKKKEPLLMTN
ncbi:hypothetical protein BpHYR1_029881 [Brachionus plicatilis]|uniref:Uncharacterized protein n=1 Tax=Brachionus plicatilis TaxID=10195 RepID=A0A3M7PKC8_BRAPC|nr:hypothetical protein BpHYR1_029881 [Brachionus plicatilis]